MENTLENKAKFFALYWGQKILKVKKQPELLWLNNHCNNIGVTDYLELTPLSDIPDEDAKELSYRIGTIVDLDRRIMTNSIDLMKELIDNYTKVNMMWMLPTRFTDKARELGYAIEWNEVSVEKQIEYGWITLKPKSNGK